jgi:hypothetical protein
VRTNPQQQRNPFNDCSDAEEATGRKHNDDYRYNRLDNREANQESNQQPGLRRLSYSRNKVNNRRAQSEESRPIEQRSTLEAICRQPPRD